MSFYLIEDECWIWGPGEESSPGSNLPWKRFMIMGYEALSPKVSLVTINSFSSALCMQKGHLARWMGKKEGCSGAFALLLFRPLECKVVWKLRAICVYYANRPSLGLWSLLFFYSYHWDFPECLQKGELVVVLAQLVWDIVEAWPSHCIWACFSPWPLKTFSQRTGSVGLTYGYTQRTQWLEMGALLWPWCSKILS